MKLKPEEKEAEKAYDIMAETYHNHRTKVNPKGWFYNEMLEMPATLSLLGNVKNKKILDFGCGTGIYAKILEKKGAKIKGFDISEEMLKIARKNNPRLDLRQGSGYKIPFNEKFDIVVAALVIDYFDNWDKVFQQVSKVLKKGGVFVFSAGNPVCECAKRIKSGRKSYKVLGIRSYFDEKVHHCDWSYKDGKTVTIPSYHKTYETIIKTIIKNGFEIADYKDTFPLKKAKKLFPEDYAEYSKSPYFCVWKVRKVK
jgi:SAM-dependent methyltransferase